jgi:hypothetical protein
MDGLKKFYDGVNEKLEGYDNLDIYTHSPEEDKELMETIKNLPEVKGKTITFDVNTEDFDLVSTPLVLCQEKVQIKCNQFSLF